MCHSYHEGKISASFGLKFREKSPIIHFRVLTDQMDEAKCEVTFICLKN